MAVSITVAGNHVFHCVGHVVRNSAQAILDSFRASSDVIFGAIARASDILASFV